MLGNRVERTTVSVPAVGLCSASRMPSGAAEPFSQALTTDDRSTRTLLGTPPVPTQPGNEFTPPAPKLAKELGANCSS